jgi:formate hydrogenlyase subunit 4
LGKTFLGGKVQPKKKKRTGFTIWFTLVILGGLLATFIPYGILGTLTPSLAIFGFWVLFGLAIVAAFHSGNKIK